MVFRPTCLFLIALLSAPVFAQDPQAADPEQRAKAAKELADQGSGALPKLAAMLSDPDVEVRVEVVKSIVSIGTQHSLDPLLQATRDNDPEVQIRATDGLVNFYLPGYVQTGISGTLRRAKNVVSARWTDVNDQVVPNHVTVRPEVVEALGKLARGGASMASRANAARAVGVLRGRAALPDVIQALHSKDDQVIYEGLVAIQKIRDPEAAPKISFLLRDFNEKIQIAAIETTGLLQNREALQQLREVLSRARSKKVQRAALTAMAMIPDPADRTIYAQYLASKEEDLRAAAAEGFARLKDPAELPMLEQRFNSEQKMSPRLSLAFALASLGKREVSELSPLQYLINSLNSKSWRGVSRAFLIELTREPEVRKSVQDATRAGTKDEKIMLAQILAVSGDKDTVPYIEALTHDSDTDVVEEAIRSMKTLKARL